MKLTEPERRSIITCAAYDAAVEHGLSHVTSHTVAAHCSIKTSRWTVRKYFPRDELLRVEAVKIAEECDHYEIVAQGQALGINSTQEI